MSKAVLIIDMPDNCYDCILNYDSFCCSINNTNFFDSTKFDPVKTRLNNCPLKLLPEEDKECHYPDEYEDGYADGWNACIKEINKA